MKPRTDNERLLDYVLAGDDAGFRDALFVETLSLVRRRRRFRQLRRAAPGLALIVGLAMLWWRGLPLRVASPEAARARYAIVHTRPLPATVLVSTQPLAANLFVVSASNAPIIQTAASGGLFREIDDSELLSLVGSKPAALVRYGQHSAELLFVNATDEQELLRN